MQNTYVTVLITSFNNFWAQIIWRPPFQKNLQLTNLRTNSVLFLGFNPIQYAFLNNIFFILVLRHNLECKYFWCTPNQGNCGIENLSFLSVSSYIVFRENLILFIIKKTLTKNICIFVSICFYMLQNKTKKTTRRIKYTAFSVKINVF